MDRQRFLLEGLHTVEHIYTILALMQITCQNCHLANACHDYAAAYSPRVCSLWREKGGTS